MMAGVSRQKPPPLTADSIPKLPRHVKLKHDKLRERWVILAPERVIVPDDIAVAVLSLVDGARSVSAIAATLARTYSAPADLILGDSLSLLQNLADRGFLLTVPEVRDA